MNPASAPATSATHILVIDDEPDLRTLYELSLVREGYRVSTADSVAQAQAALNAQRFDVVISDMNLPDGQGLEILRSLAQQQRSERCIVITAYGSAENAVEALKAGAFDYLTKPVDLKQFRATIAQAAQRKVPAEPIPVVMTPEAVAQPTAQTLRDDDIGEQALQRLVGSSEAMQQVRARIRKIAKTMAPVLVRGESGTGKELVARAIHACSHRASGPFVAVNCSAIPETLLEAEFFGVRKGAYTGATQDREGYFQAAHDGTLFLDEVGDLPLSMQAKLLRVIQERMVRALGATQEESVNVRIISATHVDVAAQVNLGRFRQDLFYRLNVIDIHLPALRERREDIPELVMVLLKRLAAETGAPVADMSAHALAELVQMPFVGNVRELENMLHRALALSDGHALELQGITAGDESLPLPLTIPSSPAMTPEPEVMAVAVVQAQFIDSPEASATLPQDLQSHLDAQERAILLRALQETGFNRTAAAARLGINLRQIRYRMARLGIEAPRLAGGNDMVQDA
jgi:two-component system, NtrC family, response regulator PilR